MTKQERIAAYVAEQLDTNPPRSQMDGCRLGARASILVGDAPKTDLEYIDAAAGAARGLFGPAFYAADDGQKAIWMMMCEDALRLEMSLIETPSK